MIGLAARIERIFNARKARQREAADTDALLERTREWVANRAICGARWMARRIEAETVPVEHVCGLAFRHAGSCICPCGASN